MLRSMQNLLFNCHTRINLKKKQTKNEGKRKHIWRDIDRNMLLTSITHWGCVVFYYRHSQEACSSLYKCDTKQNVFIEALS